MSFMENKVFGIAAFAVLIEGIISYISEFFVHGSFCWEMFLSLVLGVTIVVAYKLDLPAYFNLTSEIPYVGCILTGILLSRGSNYIFDLITKISGV